MERENSIFPLRNNKKYFMRIFANAFIAIILLGALALWFYVENITVHMEVDESVYYAAADGLDMYVVFNEGCSADIVVCSQYMEVVSKTHYLYEGYNWKKLIGNWYFSKNSFRSLTSVRDGSSPSTASFVCTDSYYIDMISYDEIKSVRDEETIGNSFVSTIYFFDNKMLFDSTSFMKVEAVDPVVLELLRLHKEFE